MEKRLKWDDQKERDMFDFGRGRGRPKFKEIPLTCYICGKRVVLKAPRRSPTCSDGCARVWHYLEGKRYREWNK